MFYAALRPQIPLDNIRFFPSISLLPSNSESSPLVMLMQLTTFDEPSQFTSSNYVIDTSHLITTIFASNKSPYSWCLQHIPYMFLVRVITNFQLPAFLGLDTNHGGYMGTQYVYRYTTRMHIRSASQSPTEGREHLQYVVSHAHNCTLCCATLQSLWLYSALF